VERFGVATLVRDPPITLSRADAPSCYALAMRSSLLSRSAALLFGVLALAGCTDAAAPNAVDMKVIGNPAPSFELKAINTGASVSMSSLSGQVVVVDFWGTFCEPCKKSFPKLQALYSKYKGSGVTVVGISEDDDKDGIAAFGGSYGAKFPLVWDESHSAAGKWNPGSMPATFIVDRKGVVRFFHQGYREGDELEIEQQVKSLL
jgi:cytochrome c biogenesis protein CcmG, thiol:disulfide interchange protein DsbE